MSDEMYRGAEPDSPKALLYRALADVLRDGPTVANMDALLSYVGPLADPRFWSDVQAVQSQDVRSTAAHTYDAIVSLLHRRGLWVSGRSAVPEGTEWSESL